MSDHPKYVLNGREYPVVTDYTLGEMCDAERLFGVSFDEEQSSARFVAASIFISVRRVDSSVTVDDIRGIASADLAEIARVAEGDARPPDSQSSSGSESDASRLNSGDGSSNGSESRDRILATTGAAGASSPISDPAT